MSTTRPAAPVVVHTKGGGLMSSSEYAANEPAADPLAPVEQAIHWLTSTTIHLALGLMVGLLAARAMRQRHLHWAWPAIVLGAIVLGRSILGASLVSILGTGALSAAVRGRRWHREDLDAGADLAALAAHRRTPPDALRAFARRVAALTRRATVERACARDGRLTVGYDRDGRAVAIPCGGASGGTHTLVAGAAGSGKTVTMTWIALCAIARGMGVIAIDPKGDRDLRWALRDALCGPGDRSSNGALGAGRSTTPTGVAARRRSPTGRSPASASPSPTTCAKPSATWATRSACCARRASPSA
jgi:Bacterial protein of unknown function (DUF853)